MQVKATICRSQARCFLAIMNWLKNIAFFYVKIDGHLFLHTYHACYSQEKIWFIILTQQLQCNFPGKSETSNFNKTTQWQLNELNDLSPLKCQLWQILPFSSNVQWVRWTEEVFYLGLRHTSLLNPTYHSRYTMDIKRRLNRLCKSKPL